MPRQARLDAPGTLHHVILRGIERGQIVTDREDGAMFLARLGEVAMATGTTLYAWALLPNHAHLLLRSGAQGLPCKRGRREVMKVIEKSPILIALKNGRRSNLCRLPGAPGKYVGRGLRNCGAVGVVVADL